MSSKLLPDEIPERLLQNGRLQQKLIQEGEDADFWPVVKLFTPDGDFIWLLTELDPDDPDLAYGLWDLGSPELGSVRLSELEAMSSRLGIRIEHCPLFTATKTLCAYADEAWTHGVIKA